jgi:hypothetical protein
LNGAFPPSLPFQLFPHPFFPSYIPIIYLSASVLSLVFCFHPFICSYYCHSCSHTRLTAHLAFPAYDWCCMLFIFRYFNCHFI